MSEPDEQLEKLVFIENEFDWKASDQFIGPNRKRLQDLEAIQRAMGPTEVYDGFRQELKDQYRREHESRTRRASLKWNTVAALGGAAVLLYSVRFTPMSLPPAPPILFLGACLSTAVGVVIWLERSARPS